MSTVYQIRVNGTVLEFVKDMVFGWAVREDEPGIDFEPIEGMTAGQINFLLALSYPEYLREIVPELTKVRDKLLAEKEKVVEAAKPSAPSAKTTAGLSDAPFERKPNPESVKEIRAKVLDLLAQGVPDDGLVTADLDYVKIALSNKGWLLIPKGKEPELIGSLDAVCEEISMRWW